MPNRVTQHIPLEDLYRAFKALPPVLNGWKFRELKASDMNKGAVGSKEKGLLKRGPQTYEGQEMTRQPLYGRYFYLLVLGDTVFWYRGEHL